MLIKMNKLVRDQRGATLIEYVLLIGVVALLAIGGFKTFGGSIKKKIGEQAAAVDGVNGAATEK
jgi:pilus assembly protein Flp/PilA